RGGRADDRADDAREQRRRDPERRPGFVVDRGDQRDVRGRPGRERGQPAEGEPARRAHRGRTYRRSTTTSGTPTISVAMYFTKICPLMKSSDPNATNRKTIESSGTLIAFVATTRHASWIRSRR